MSVGGRASPGHLSDAALRELDELVADALERRDEAALPTLGHGEISLVLSWPLEGPAFACKRLPSFPSPQRFDAYGRVLDDYLSALREAGVGVVETELRAVPLPRGEVAGYVVQPILATDRLAPHLLDGADPRAGHPLVDAVVDSAARTVGPRLGLDAQLANWVWDDDELTYIDVSTPLIWDAQDRPRLDLDLIAEPFPWVLRAPLKRFVAPGILDTYRDLRKVYLDLCGNLLKERLEAWLPGFVERANARLAEPLTVAEVRAYYRRDSRLWEALLRIRRLDRAWQQRVRRRTYPFLLPGGTRR